RAPKPPPSAYASPSPLRLSPSSVAAALARLSSDPLLSPLISAHALRAPDLLPAEPPTFFVALLAEALGRSAAGLLPLIKNACEGKGKLKPKASFFTPTTTTTTSSSAPAGIQPSLILNEVPLEFWTRARIAGGCGLTPAARDRVLSLASLYATWSSPPPFASLAPAAVLALPPADNPASVKGLTLAGVGHALIRAFGHADVLPPGDPEVRKLLDVALGGGGEGAGGERRRVEAAGAWKGVRSVAALVIREAGRKGK
ncbi:hypothetical protein TeGR_g435, partial [Tetraparma gracilis]